MRWPFSKAQKTTQLCQFRQLRQFRVYVVFFVQPFVKRFTLCYQTVVCPVLSLLSAMLVYCGQTVGRIKMKLGTQVSLGLGHIVLDWDPAPSPKRGEKPPPQFSAHVHCGQTAGWIKMALGMEVGLIGAGYIVLDGDPAPFPKKGQSPPIFVPFLLWPNSWMHQNAAWYAGRPLPGDFVLDGDPAPSPKRGGSPHISSHVYCGQTA